MTRVRIRQGVEGWSITWRSGPMLKTRHSAAVTCAASWVFSSFAKAVRFAKRRGLEWDWPEDLRIREFPNARD